MSFFRLLLLFLLGWIVWRLLRPSSRKTTEKRDDPETIAACALCGVYVPESEMVRDRNGQKYCCQAHLRQANTQ
ncbi:MAG: hypothetical protein FWH15_04150 [Betaproteobacteria bacterium]|nr:hypothetical protein [Betaproteobacteria bacterium]